MLHGPSKLYFNNTNFGISSFFSMSLYINNANERIIKIKIVKWSNDDTNIKYKYSPEKNYVKNYYNVSEQWMK